MAQYTKIDLTNVSYEEWLELRKTGLGGSDIGSVLGLSKWRSAVEVYLDKIGEIEPLEQNEAMYWGTVLEPVVAQEFSKRTGLLIQEEKAMYRHNDYPHMLANIDRWIFCPERGLGILEVKTGHEFMKAAWEGDKVPDYYMLQLQHYFAVTGAKWGYFAYLLGGQTFDYKYVERDENLIAAMIEAEADFWKLVEDRTPPDLDGSYGATELLKKMFPVENVKAETIELDEEADALADLYDAAKEQEEAAKKDKQAAENKLKQLLGDNTKGRTPKGRTVSWSLCEPKKEKFDADKFAESHPELYKEFSFLPPAYRRWGGVK